MVWRFINERRFFSNCLVEALKAKCLNPAVKIYYCRPRFTKSGFEMLHFMWSDGVADYDFSDDETTYLPWYRCFWFKGGIRQFKLGFAERYTEGRNKKKNKI